MPLGQPMQVVWLYRLHADHEQVDDMQISAIADGMVMTALIVWPEPEVQERRERVHQIAGAPGDEQNAQPSGEHP